MGRDLELPSGDIVQFSQTTLTAAKASTKPLPPSQNVAGQPGKEDENEKEKEKEQNKYTDKTSNSSTVFAEGSTPGLQDAIDGDTLHEELNPAKVGQILISDWSQTGRGSHVEFAYAETVPLEQGRYLGRGATSDVYETIVQGCKLAHKRLVFRRKIGDAELKEIEILKKISSHTHMMQLVGTYTHRQFLGLLLHPVAVCDLHTFFEDVEAWSNIDITLSLPEARQAALDPLHRNRLEALGYDFPTAASRSQASKAYHKIGCLISAIEYLHEQKIRHKDLKPSNILLTQDRLWLSDFGSATDFSLLSQSATDNERGTPRYFSPEVANWKPNGRAADIFSLGCVLLEIAVLHDRGTLEHIRQNRSQDPSFYANLDRVDIWCTTRARTCSRRHHIMQEIKLMLGKDAAYRPTAKELLIRISGYDIASTAPTIFDRCCANLFVTEQQRDHDKRTFETVTNKLEADLKEAKKVRDEKQDDYDRMYKMYQESEEQRTSYQYRIRDLEDSERALGLENEDVQEHANQQGSRYKRRIIALAEEVAKLSQALSEKDRMLQDSQQAMYDKLTGTHVQMMEAKERGLMLRIKSLEEQLNSRLAVSSLPDPRTSKWWEGKGEKVALEVARNESSRPLASSSSIGSVDDSKTAAGVSERRKAVRRRHPPVSMRPPASDEDGDASSHLLPRPTSASQRSQVEGIRTDSSPILRRKSPVRRKSSQQFGTPNVSEYRDHDYVRSSNSSIVPSTTPVEVEPDEAERYSIGKDSDVPGNFFERHGNHNLEPDASLTPNYRYIYDRSINGLRKSYDTGGVIMERATASDAQSEYERRSIERRSRSRSPAIERRSRNQIPGSERSSRSRSPVVKRRSRSRSPERYATRRTRRSTQVASNTGGRRSSFDRLSLERRLSNASLRSDLSKQEEPEKKSLTKRLGKALGFARK